MADLYGFSQQSAQRIASAVKKVESMAGDSQQPAYEPETTGTESFKDRHVGTFSGVWAIGATADVTVTADNGSTYTEEAKNYFASVGAEGETNNCCIIQAGSEWILIAAQCEEIPPLENVVD